MPSKAKHLHKDWNGDILTSDRFLAMQIIGKNFRKFVKLRIENKKLENQKQDIQKDAF